MPAEHPQALDAFAEADVFENRRVVSGSCAPRNARKMVSYYYITTEYPIVYSFNLHKVHCQESGSLPAVLTMKHGNFKGFTSQNRNYMALKHGIT
jgi:hypothetical protein